MEYAKDIVLNLKEGQAERKTGVIQRMAKKISEHKIMTTIISATISFVVLDVILISSFVNILISF